MKAAFVQIMPVSKGPSRCLRSRQATPVCRLSFSRGSRATRLVAKKHATWSLRGLSDSAALAAAAELFRSASLGVPTLTAAHGALAFGALAGVWAAALAARATLIATAHAAAAARAIPAAWDAHYLRKPAEPTPADAQDIVTWLSALGAMETANAADAMRDLAAGPENTRQAFAEALEPVQAVAPTNAGAVVLSELGKGTSPVLAMETKEGESVDQDPAAMPGKVGAPLFDWMVATELRILCAVVAMPLLFELACLSGSVAGTGDLRLIGLGWILSVSGFLAYPWSGQAWSMVHKAVEADARQAEIATPQSTTGLLQETRPPPWW